jgi:hypothetical protein
MHWVGIEPETSKQEFGDNSPSKTLEDYNAVPRVGNTFVQSRSGTGIWCEVLCLVGSYVEEIQDWKANRIGRVKATVCSTPEKVCRWSVLTLHFLMRHLGINKEQRLRTEYCTRNNWQSRWLWRKPVCSPECKGRPWAALRNVGQCTIFVVKEGNGVRFAMCDVVPCDDKSSL